MDTQRINMELELGACGLLILLDALFFEAVHSDPSLKSQGIELCEACAEKLKTVYLQLYG